MVDKCANVLSLQIIAMWTTKIGEQTDAKPAVPFLAYAQDTFGINIYTFILERCSLSGPNPFFGDLSAARPRLNAKLAPCDSPQPRGP